MATHPDAVAQPEASPRLSLEHVLGTRDQAERSDSEALALAVRDGLLARSKTLPCRFFYDAAGSELFEQICRLPEYYLTRTENAILRAHAASMVDFGDGTGGAGAPVFIELGSGSAEKTRHLIEAGLARYGPIHYVPIDVSVSAVRSSARRLTREFPTLRVTGFVADYHQSLAEIVARFPGPKLLTFLGSSLGNYDAEGAASLLAGVARCMVPDDRFLLGTDLVKDAGVLERAYDDARGVTARFNRNLLVRINRELGADFRPELFEHRAVYRPGPGRVEMHLVSRIGQVVHVPGAGLTVTFAKGESIHTENSHKYTPEVLAGLSARAGFREDGAWTDPDGWFRVQRWQAEATG